jgi:hypothetical protein
MIYDHHYGRKVTMKSEFKKEIIFLGLSAILIIGIAYLLGEDHEIGLFSGNLPLASI